LTTDRRTTASCLLLLPLLHGCIQDMWNGAKYKPLERSPIFANRNSSRPLVAGVVARGEADQPPAFYTGRDDTPAAKLVTRFPLPLTRALLDRGEERYNIYCSPCHGRTGDANGIIVQRGFTAPPSYYSPRLMAAPVGHFYDVITNGWGVMYSYADRVHPADRWAIAAYIRVLQRSRSGTLADVPADQRSMLAGGSQ
jgi:mono/diheme cytochrome c family protein